MANRENEGRFSSSVALDKDITIAVDSSGIKVSNRVEWMREKRKVKRGFIKVHIAVDMKTRQILAIEVTKGDVGGGCLFGRSVKGSTDVANVKRVIGDGECDSENNFQRASDMVIDPVIRVRRNASLKAAGCMARKFAVFLQLGNADWRKEKGYGYRWMAESVFSSIKQCS